MEFASILSERLTFLKKIRELTESFYNKYNVLEISKENFLKASEIREHHIFFWGDSLILASALYAGAEIFYSEDMQDSFIIEKIRIVNPLK